MGWRGAWSRFKGLKNPGKANYSRDNWTAEGKARPQPAPRDWNPQEEGKPEGQKTKAGTPRPTAKAKEPQDPEPPAETQREEGNKPAGQTPEGKDTHSPPTAPTARTQAAERAANPPRPEN